MDSSRKQTIRTFLLCIVVLTVIFALLYNPFLFGGKMYAYEDIGCDTIHQYLPNYTIETDLLQQGGSDGYYLQVGLGRYVSALWTKYLNPSNILLFVFGSENLHISLLVTTYLKYVLICFFALLFFLRILKNEKAAAICALLWTFSGFSVLWGQHYHFLTYMVGFSASIYGFQLFLEEPKKWYITVPLLSLLVGCSYYYTYMSVFFLLIYGILYLKSQQNSFLSIVKKIGVFALLMLLTAGISGAYLSASVINFLRSARVDQVTSSLSTNNLFYLADTLMTILGRFLSNNTLGVGNDFEGTTNYYEAAVLSVSLLSVYCIAFLLQEKHRRRTLVISLICGVLLLTPWTSRLLVFSPNNHRWTYLLCFLQVMAIGYGLTEYFREQDLPETRKRAWIAVLIGDCLLGIIGLALIFYHYHIGGNWLDRNSCTMVVVICCLYHIAFLLLWKTKPKFFILLVMVAVELVLGNYATVNNRKTITVEQWYEQMYNDGTQDVVKWIQEQDDSVYRINKTYYSVCRTDSLVQGYNGMGYYHSTNSKHLINLAKTWGYKDARNWLGFEGTDWLANDMLGVKYIISKSGEYQDPETMELIYDDGTFCVYKNLDWSGFGYLCFEEMAASSLTELSRNQQAFLLTHYYYQTNNGNGPVAEIENIEEIDLLPYFTGAADCHIRQTDNGIVVTDTGTDSQMHFTLPQAEGKAVLGVVIEMTAEESSDIQLFAATENAGYASDRSYKVTYDGGTISRTLHIPVNKPVTLRLDPTTKEGQTITVHSVKLLLTDRSQLIQQQTRQRENAVTDFRQTGNTFTGNIQNPAEEETMLCIPLIYSEDWEARVDGKEVAVYNINGGLTGLKIPAGVHSFELSYNDAGYTFGKVISWCSIGLYFALVLYWYKRSKKK